MAGRDYAYAVGRIRILETKLLPVGFFERLLKAASAQEALRLMDETVYASDALADDFEQAMEEELFRVYRFLRDLTADAPELLVFLRRWDIHNLKLLVVTDGQGNPSTLGVTPITELKQMVADGNFTALPKEFQTTLTALPENGPERAAALDRAYYQYAWGVFGKRGGLLQDYWRARLDLLNLLIFLRLRKMGANAEELSRFMVEPGFIPKDAWCSEFTEEQPKLTKLLEHTPYRALLSRDEEILTKLPSLEREIDNFLLEIMKRAKVIPLGIEPVIGYLLAKEREILNLRLVFTGQMNKLPEETVKGRLRHVYF